MQITYLTDRPGHASSDTIDAYKQKRELGWKSAETFETGAYITVQWYQDNPDWVTRVQSGTYQDWVQQVVRVSTYLIKVLILQKNGQVDWELQRILAPLGELIALDRHSSDYFSDLSKLTGLADLVRTIRPDVMGNAAEHTAVDEAESEPDMAHTLYAQVPEVLAVEAARLDAWLVHFSTDYVFDGSGDEPWFETHATGPLSLYDASKHTGEALNAQHCPRHLIFRTSWISAARGSSFAKTMLRLGTEQERLTVVNDQFCAPTGAELVADVTSHVIRHMLQSRSSEQLAVLYPLVASGETTWFDYTKLPLAQEIHLQLTIKVIAKKRADQRFLHSSKAPAQLTPGHRKTASHLRFDLAILAKRG